MPFKKLLLKPGVNLEETPTLADGTYSSANLIRWRNGLPEKRGGWTEMCATPVTGLCRSIHAWADLSADNFLALGTTSNLQLLSNGVLYDITPWRATSTRTAGFGGAFSTTAGSATVTITDAGHSASPGDQVIIDPIIAVGGLILSGIYTIKNVLGSARYTIIASANAAFSSGTGAPPFFITNSGSFTTQVLLPKHGYATNDIFPVTISTTVGGVTFLGTYSVTVLDVDNFTIANASPANATVGGSENGGNVNFYYLLPGGQPSVQPGYVWGEGTWDGGLWSESAGQAAQIRIWSLDNFGQDLIAVPAGGALYIWTPPETPPFYNPAVIEPAAPAFNEGGLVTMPEEIIMMFGSSLDMASFLDPLLLRWCDQADFTEWTPTATNQAGSFRLSRGSLIVGAVQAPATLLVWTDLDIWGGQYLGFPLVFGFSQLSNNCGLISQQAYAVDNNNVYWMSFDGFYAFTAAGVQAVPCSVWDAVYQNLNRMQSPKVIAAKNSLFNEILWFYPSASGNGEIDSYVSINTLEQSWDYGSLTRTAWTDQSVLGPPIGVDGNGIIQQHETSLDANGAAMTGVEIMTAYQDIGDGNDFVFLDQIIPDLKWLGPTPQVGVTVYFQNWPGDVATSQGPFIVTPSTEYITVRVRARQVAVKIEMDGLNMWFRLGAFRLRVSPAGRV